MYNYLAGKNECEGLGCDHSCLIQDNKPHCVCRDGYVFDEYMNCIGESYQICFATITFIVIIYLLFILLDINECALKLFSCDSSTEVCVNEEGGYHCACKTGYYYDQHLLTCLRKYSIIMYCIIIIHVHVCINNNYVLYCIYIHVRV